MSSLRDRLRPRSWRPSELPAEVPEHDDRAPLQRLVASRLGSVIFVADYVQFDFNGPRLSAFVWPHVALGDRTWQFSDAGYRDALVSLIGRDVTATQDSAETGVVVRFGVDASLHINPEPRELEGPEIAMLQANDGSAAWEIWRPGEESFANRTWGE